MLNVGHLSGQRKSLCKKSAESRCSWPVCFSASAMSRCAHAESHIAAQVQARSVVVISYPTISPAARNRSAVGLTASVSAEDVARHPNAVDPTTSVSVEDVDRSLVVAALTASVVLRSPAANPADVSAMRFARLSDTRPSARASCNSRLGLPPACSTPAKRLRDARPFSYFM